MTDSKRRVALAALIQAAPNTMRAMMFLDEALYQESAADLYGRLVQGGKEEALREAARCRARADELMKEAQHEAERAARIAWFLESWGGT